MNLRRCTLGLGVLSLGLVLAVANRPTAAQSPGPEISAATPAPQDGVTPQGRGPVHEAFAEPGSANPRATPIISKQPPDPVEEVPPDQKPEGENVRWMPGYWAYDDDAANFLWVSGCWRAYPPGRTWMPGHWTAVNGGGWQWTPGFWAAEAQKETTLLPAPPQTIDAGPSAPAPQPDSVYVAGCWVYRTRRYVWRPGFWYVPRPGWVWVPAHYVWTPCGYLFVDGYWDYPLSTRGLLFAPVVIERRFWGRPRWVFRPSFVVYEPALVGCLFVRPDYGCYYFGDYFEVRYRRLGFVAWVDFRIGRFAPDPLFAYYRWQYRGDRLWERNLRTLYVGRFGGGVARPPRTFVQQTTILNNVTINKTVNVTNVRNLTLLAPINRVDRTVVRLQPVGAARVAQERRAAAELRTLARQRQQFTTQALARPADAGRVRTWQLPRAAGVGATRTGVKPPPAAGRREVVRPPREARPVRPVVPPRGETHRPAPAVRPGPKPAADRPHRTGPDGQKPRPAHKRNAPADKHPDRAGHGKAK
jgi:hypothetical protein